MSEHTETFCAWCAGLFEGEGWVYTKESRPTDRPSRRHTLLCGMTNTDLGLLNPLKREWGGTIRIHGGSKLSKKECFEWRLCSAAAEEFLRSILPYVLGDKRDRIKIALERRKLLVRFRTRNKLGQFEIGGVA